jgi:hypothetical protein
MLIPDAFIILSEANLKIASLGEDYVDQAGTPRQPKTLQRLIRTRQLYNLLMKFIFLNQGGTAIVGTFGQNDPALNRLLLTLKRCAQIVSFPVLPNPIHSFVTNGIPEGPPGPPGTPGAKGDMGETGFATDFTITFGPGPASDIVDFFPIADSEAAVWYYVAVNTGGTKKSGSLIVHWDADGSNFSVTDSGAQGLSGSAIELQFTMDYFGGNVRLIATSTSGTWTVKGFRYFIPTNGNGSGPVSDVLPDGTFYIGNSSNTAQSRFITGVIAITNTGVSSYVAGSIVNADINANAAIAFSKMATLTANRAVVSGPDGFIISSAASLAEVAYLVGTSSPIQTQINTKLTDPTTSIGDTIIRNGSNVIARVPAGSPGQVYTMSGGLPTWQTPASGFSDPMLAAGDFIYRNGGNVTSRFAVGLNGQVVMVSGGLPTYQSISQFTVTGGTKYTASALNNGNNYVVGSVISSGGEAGNTGRAYTGVSFTTSAESNWKVRLAFTFQIKGDGGGTDQVRFSIERSTDNVTWSYVVAGSIGIATTDNNQNIYVTAFGIDGSVSTSTLYYYRLVAVNVVGGNNSFSSLAGYSINLIPG